MMSLTPSRVYGLLTVCVLSGCGHHSPQNLQTSHLFADSWIIREPHPDVLKNLKNTVSRHADWVEGITLDAVTPGGRELFVLKIESPRWRGKKLLSARTAILADESMHGYETWGLLPRLPDLFLQLVTTQTDSPARGFFDRGGVLYIIPVFNPDGYTAGVRGRMSDGDVDLNRDFPAPINGVSDFKEPETAAYTRYIESELKAFNLDLVLYLNFHCCNGNGKLFRMVNYKSPPDYFASTDQLRDLFRKHLVPDMALLDSIYDMDGYADVYYHNRHDTKAYCVERGHWRESERRSPSQSEVINAVNFWNDLLGSDVVVRAKSDFKGRNPSRG